MDKYLFVGLSVIAMMCLFAFFTDSGNIEFDYVGIVYDIKETANGYVFELEYDDGHIHSFYTERPVDLGLYGISGNYSDDGNIFFVDIMRFLEEIP